MKYDIPEEEKNKIAGKCDTIVRDKADYLKLLKSQLVPSGINCVRR